MIRVRVEYDPRFFAVRENALIEIRESIEPIVGLVFEEELDHVDVRMRRYDPLDEFSVPMFVTIDIEDDHVRRTSSEYNDLFRAHFDAHLRGTLEPIPFRVWIRQVRGSFSDASPYTEKLATVTPLSGRLDPR